MKKTIAAFVILAAGSVAANEQPSLSSLAALIAAEEAAVAANPMPNVPAVNQDPLFSVPLESVGEAAVNTASKAGEFVGEGFLFGRKVVGNMFGGLGQFASEVGAAIKP